MSSPTPQVTAALTFFSTFNTMDMKTNLALRSPSCTHSLLPSSLGYKPAMTNDEFVDHTAALSKVVASWPLDTLEITESGNQVVMHVVGIAHFKAECMDDDKSFAGYWKGGFRNEYLFVFRFDGEGKIERVFEYLDSVAVQGVRPMVARALENLQRSGK